MKFCKNCGNQLEDGATFCGKCGTAQDPVPAAPNPTPVAPQPGQSSNPIPPQNPMYGAAGGAMSMAMPKKKTKAPLIIGAVVAVILVIVLVISLVSCFGSKLSVEEVKEGYLTGYSKSVSIGDAFDDYSYFENGTWEKFKGEDEDGEKFDTVEFNATITMDNMDDWSDDSQITDTICFQFYTDDSMDEDEFALYGIFIGNVDDDDYITLDDYDTDDMLNSIYGNEIFYHIPSDYGVEY